MANTTGRKFGGRKKGTPNKETQDIRDKFQLIVEKNLVKFQADFDKLNSSERIKYTLDLAKFCLPTLKAIEHKGGFEIVERPQFLFVKKEKPTKIDNE